MRDPDKELIFHIRKGSYRTLLADHRNCPSVRKVVLCKSSSLKEAKGQKRYQNVIYYIAQKSHSQEDVSLQQQGNRGSRLGEWAVRTDYRMADRILRRWELEASLTSVNLFVMSDRLLSSIHVSWPNAMLMKEPPTALRMEGGVLMQGLIDLLLETVEGMIIIDSKSLPGLDTDELVGKYGKQLEAYATSLDRAGSLRTILKLLHLPVLGRFFKIV
jgi:hypothetical protein